MAYSIEFRRAVAAVAVTRLIVGRRNLETASQWVAARIGEGVFPDKRGKDKAMAIVEYRKRILGFDPDKPHIPRFKIARFHYDNCMKLVIDSGLRPQESAELLVDTLLGPQKK